MSSVCSISRLQLVRGVWLDGKLRPDLYGLDLGELTFHFYLYKIQPTVYMKLCTRLRMREGGNGRRGRGRVVSPRQVK